LGVGPGTGPRWVLRDAGWTICIRLKLAGLLNGSCRLCGLGTGDACAETGEQQQRHSTDAPAKPMRHAGNAAGPVELDLFHDGFPLMFVEFDFVSIRLSSINSAKSKKPQSSKDTYSHSASFYSTIARQFPHSLAT
jgi:hypothetical protein